jgi:hypothetical protein
MWINLPKSRPGLSVQLTGNSPTPRSWLQTRNGAFLQPISGTSATFRFRGRREGPGTQAERPLFLE